MPIQNCPIDIPEGWEPVECRKGIRGEHCLHSLHPLRIDDDETDYPVLIIRRARQKLEVGDVVRVSHPGGSADGKRGVVREAPSNLLISYLVHVNGIGALHYQRDNIIKQIRKIEPYAMDQCIAEIAIRGGRDVMRGGEPAEIVTVYSNGVSTDGPHIGFVSYGSAAKVITWPNGDAFGVVTWEDAE